MFYDVREYLPILQKVFRLNRHPRFYIWTNRFPVSYLEDLEDLIQDPHKMLDEVNGRRFQVRRYLDEGKALDCRDPERCQHCFIEPFCTTMERMISSQNTECFDVWQMGRDREAPEELPFGCSRIGIEVTCPSEVSELSFAHPLEVEAELSSKLPRASRDIRWVAKSAEQLSAWVPTLCRPYSIEVSLNAGTAA